MSQGSEQNPLPPKEVLQQLAAYSKTAVLPVTGSILAAMAAAGPDAAGGSAAIMSLPGHEDLEYAALAKSCCGCNKPEERQVCGIGSSSVPVWWSDANCCDRQHCTVPAVLT